MVRTLSPGGLIRIKALPSIYQEFQLSRKDVKCVSIMELLNIPSISAIVNVALEDKKTASLAAALRILEEENLPLYNDFVEVLERTLNIRRGDWDNELRLLYRLLLLNMLLNMRKDDILNSYFEQLDEVRNIAERLRDLLRDIDGISTTLCRDSPLCIKVMIQPKKRAHSLKNEVDGILKALNTTEQWARELRSGSLTSPKHFIAVAFMTVFGLPEESEILLDQIKTSLKEWYDRLYERIYKQLMNLQQKLSQLPIRPLENIKKEIPIRIESLGAVDGAGKEISDVLREVKELVRDYNKVISKIEEHKRDIQTQLEDILDSINKLKEV